MKKKADAKMTKLDNLAKKFEKKIEKQKAKFLKNLTHKKKK
jgi:hypothetical protein